MSERTIDDYHATRESGSGCPGADGGPHYFAFIDPSAGGRICIDCGEPEPIQLSADSSTEGDDRG